MVSPPFSLSRSLCVFCLLMKMCVAIELQELTASTLDLALARPFAAILFYDKSSAGQALTTVWEGAAQLLDSLPDDATMATVDGTDSELKELVDAYGITIPSIRVFRRSVMGEYRGPRGGSSEDIAEYIKQDSMVRTRFWLCTVFPHTHSSHRTH